MSCLLLMPDEGCIGPDGIPHQLIMTALLHNLPLLHNSYAVCIPDSAEAVRHNDAGAPHHQLL